MFKKAVQLFLALLLASCAGLPSSSGSTPRIRLQLWQVGSPYKGDTQSTVPPQALVDACRKLGLSLSMRAFPAKGFYDVLSSAFAEGKQPDILFFDNMGILKGAKTSAGAFTGLESEPSLRDSLMQVSESLNYARGWQYLIKGSANHEAARKLVLRELDKPCETLPEGLAEAASLAAAAVAKRDEAAVLELSGGGFALETNFINPPEAGSGLGESLIFDSWGNDHLAFTSASLSYEGERSIGTKRYLLVFAKADAGWRLMDASDAWAFPATLRARLPALKGAQGLLAFGLTGPAEGSRFPKRFPEAERPMISWGSAGGNARIYLLEWQYGWGPAKSITWSASGFMPFIPASGSAKLELRAPGIGAQPHKVRIWAIDGAGTVETSPWRTFSYDS